MIEVIRHVKWLLSPLLTLCHKYQMTLGLLVEGMIYYHRQEGDFQGLSLKCQNTSKFQEISKAYCSSATEPTGKRKQILME